MIGAVGTLPEVHEPTGLPAPIPLSLTVEIEVALHVGMKDERQNGEAGAGEPVGRSGLRNFVRTIFLDENIPRLARKRGNIIVLSCLCVS